MRVRSWQGVSNRWTGIWNGTAEWNGGIENGLEWFMYAVTCATGTAQLPTVSLGSYRKGCISKSSVACILPCLIISLSENGAFPTIEIPWTHPLLLSI